MDPRTYCGQVLDALLDAHRDRPPDDAALRRGSVLAYLAQLRLSADAFPREVRRLSRRTTRERRPELAAAARAILADWRAAVGC
jgi:hypothetical protein